MKQPTKLVMGLLLFVSSLAFAEFPVANMDPHSLGIQYGLAFRGENITSSSVASHETIHLLSIAYSPLPYLSLEGGVGVDQFSVDPSKQIHFKGDYGISPVFGLSLFTPVIADIVRFTAGSRALFLNSEDVEGYKYSGFISNPFLGLLVSPSPFVDVTAGLRMLLIDGQMSGPNSSPTQAFANPDMNRGYLAVTLKSPADRAFLTLDLDASPSLNSDWSNGPREATIGISFGAMLGWRTRANVNASTNTNTPRDSSGYFPAIPEMKAKQDKMAKEIE